MAITHCNVLDDNEISFILFVSAGTSSAVNLFIGICDESIAIIVEHL